MKVQEEIQGIVRWLQNSVKETHTEGLVVGLSGGIDSAVVGALAKLAFPSHSLGVILPIHSNPKDAEHARTLAVRLDLKTQELDLSKEHAVLLAKITEPLAFPIGRTTLTDANLRARLRMVSLYTIANALNYVVLGTDNAAELYTGYFTKFGDGACDFLPLAPYTKEEVRTLAKALGVPQEILDKEPSAGLWEGQTDEEEMGTTYAYIDAYLKGEAIPETHRQRIEELHQRSNHKRMTPPKYERNDRKRKE